MTMNKALVAQIKDALEAVQTSASLKTSSPLGLAATNALRCLAALVEDEKCNGWSNWETWNVKLWLDNDESTHNAAREIVAGAELNNGIAAQALLDYATTLCLGDEPPASMAADLINGALGAVNWQEIAAAYAEAMAEG
jgi:hypothetical protein